MLECRLVIQDTLLGIFIPAIIRLDVLHPLLEQALAIKAVKVVEILTLCAPHVIAFHTDLTCNLALRRSQHALGAVLNDINLDIISNLANGRKIWKWTGPVITEEAPKEIIFTNHDLLTPIMPFANGGYYNYDRLMYKAGQTTPSGMKTLKADHDDAGDYYYDLQGRSYTQKPTSKGVYIKNGKKMVF